MKKFTFLLLTVLLFLSGCQDNPNPSRDISLTPMPTIQPSTDTPSPIPSPSPTLSPTPTEAGVLQDGILYRFVTVEGLTEIRQKNGEGIALDLNGDGVMEYLYTCEEGIFINGIKQETGFKWEHINYTDSQHLQDWETYWIVDADIQDSYYNLIFQFTRDFSYEALTYYDGTWKQIAEAELFYFATDPGYSKAQYYGNGTYLMTGCMGNLMGHYYNTEIEYLLVKDTETGNIMQEQISEFLPILLEPEYEKPLALLDSITMYTEPDLKSESFTVKPQLVYATAASDNWVQVFLADHTTQAWIYVEFLPNPETGYGSYITDHNKNCDEIFSGFGNAG